MLSFHVFSRVLLFLHVNFFMYLCDTSTDADRSETQRRVPDVHQTRGRLEATGVQSAKPQSGIHQKVCQSLRLSVV